MNSTNKTFGIFSNIFYVYKEVIKHKWYLCCILLLSLISTIGTRFIWLYMSKAVIENVANCSVETVFIKQILGITCIAIVFMLLQTVVFYWVDPAAYYIRPMFMLRRNQKFFNIKFGRTELKEVLDSRQKSVNATSWPHNGVEGLIRKTIIITSEIATCIVAMIILGKSSPIMIIIVLFFGTLSYIMINKTSYFEKEYSKDKVVYEKRKEEFFTKTTRDFTYGKDIRIFDVADRLLATIKELNYYLHKKICNAWIRCEITTRSFEMMRETIMYILLICLIVNGEYSIADFALYIGCVRNFASSYHIVSKTFAEIKNCSREVDDFRNFEALCNNGNMVKKDIPIEDDYRFEFRNVSFMYPSTNRYVLKNINITIEVGTKLAVVGLNGAGKTTFIKLLLGLYEPSEGEILMNGVNIQEFDRNAYYRVFAPVFQDMECYAFTLAENISMKDISETDVKKADMIARKVGLGNKLDEWKDGIYTNLLKILHEDGVILSGGEIQKMGLARALYKNAPVAILDEPTAALDVMAERKMYEDFDELIKGRTAVYISHRLASTKFCDVVAMFQEGKIIEYGTHDELMMKKGKYYEMFDMQACYYRENNVEGAG